MGTLELHGLTKIFDDGGGGDIVAVDDLDISLNDGEFLVLVGPSGCGKSTTLRCIAGLETATSGEIRLDGREITDAKPKEREMAMVFQNYALYPHMTVRQNIGYGLKITTDLSKEEIRRRVERTADMLEIPELLDKKPKELSGGQQQRVALGRAIIREPEVFLMDEPLSNLDAKLRSQMRTELQRLQEDLETTTIYVTHDQTEAMTMGDRIAVLDGGELQQIGTPLECYHQPENLFVAGFIGSPSMNFLDVTLDGDRLVHDDFTYRLPEELRQELDARRGDLTLGIRPEHIELCDPDRRNAIETPVEVIEPMGDISHIYIDVGGQSLTASVSGDARVNGGDVVSVVMPEEKIHLFDAESGEAVRNSTSAGHEDDGTEPSFLVTE
jgi:multiple sugar transport system ATP-binding protein